MPEIINIADWYAMQEQIAAGGKAVSGMTAAEAQAALNASAIATNSSGNLYVYGSQNTPTVKPPIQFPGTNASQAAGDFVSGGGLTNSNGAAISGTGSSQVSNLTMTQSATGVTTVGGLLSVNLPTAAAAIAPLAGVAIGAGLYSLNPDLWGKISRALLPFCYEGTDLLPVVVDENGVTYFSETAIEAVKGVLLENKGNSTATSTDADLSDKLSPYPFPFSITNLGLVYGRGSVPEGYRATFAIEFDTTVSFMVGISHVQSTDGRYFFYVGASRTPFRYRTRYFEKGDDIDLSKASWKNAYTKQEYNGESYYSTYSFGNMVFGEYLGSSQLTSEYYSGMDNNLIALIAPAMLFNSDTEFPAGISNWTGSEYPIGSAAALGVISSINPDGSVVTEPYYPITMPVGDPGISVDPATTPDITVNPNPEPAINPWISPNPAPGTYPGDVPQSNPAPLPEQVPDYTPNLDPNADPSQEPSPEPEPDPEPPKSDKGDSGTSPNPVIPIIPVLPSAAAGLLHVYNPTQSQLNAFGSWLWTTFSGDLIDTLSKLFNDPMDAVIGLHELYTTPAISGSATIRAGYLDSGVGANLVGSRYTSINCGSVVVPEYYQNYLDYSPYTKCFIYLPFVGIVPVSADDIIGNAVNITYNVDSYNGCCIAIVTVARAGYSSTVYQFEGNCGVEIPITSGYQSTLMGGLLGIAGTAISGSPHVGLAAASLGRANLGKNEVSHSGSFGSSYGAMGAKIPYIIVKRPTQKSVVNYNQEYGFPAHKRVTIGACSGYLRAREVHVVSPTATDEEKARIEEMLKEGVFVK